MKVLFLLAFLILTIQTKTTHALTTQTIQIAYIAQIQNHPPALSNLDAFIPLKGLAGLQLAISENNITGQFTGHKYKLKKIIVPATSEVIKTYKAMISADDVFVISNLPTEQLTQIAKLDSSKEKLFFNVMSAADKLRNKHCFSNVLHTLPSYAMLADALAQYMLKKRWKRWFLVVGTTQEDKHYANAIKRAAKRFGIQIIAEKLWTHTHDARRTAQSDIPVFTQGVDYDVLVVADEQGLFGEYFAYRTWIPRPVVGTQGLVATSWHRTHEQWGAAQIQNRFKAKAGRWMQEQDYAAYLAVRAIGEASVRTQSKQMQPIKTYLLGTEFALQGYKGRPLSFRPWNGQLRQPVLLAAARSMVTVAPLEGFLHPTTELDTLGFDRAESECIKHTKINHKTLNPLPEIQNKNNKSIIQNFIHKLISKINSLNRK